MAMEESSSGAERKIDVLHVTEACGGGVARHLGFIVPGLEARGVHCAVCGFGGRVSDEFRQDMETYKELSCETDLYECGYSGLPGAVSHLWQLVHRWQPAVIHAHSTMAGVVCRWCRYACPQAKLVYSPHAFALHPSLPLYVRLTARELEAWGAGYTDAYAFVGRSEIQDANRIKLPPNKFHLIENGLPASFAQNVLSREDARRELGIDAEAQAAVIPCRLAQQKGLDQVVYAMEILKGEYPGLKIFFCGDGPQRDKLERLVEIRGVSGNIHFLGQIPDLSNKLSAFDFAILPSRYEGLSYVLLECLASGVPLVVSDIMANIPRPELRDILNVFALENVQSLVEVIQACLEKPEMPRDRAQRGVEFMKSNFTLESQIAKLFNLYRMLG